VIECIRYTAINKSTCLGVATIYISKWGIELSGISLHKKDSKRWVNLPSKVIEEGGEKKYFPILKFRENEHRDKFLKLIRDAINVYMSTDKENKVEEEIPF